MNPLPNSGLTEEEYKILMKYIYSICGITLNEDKKYLIHQRLEPLAESLHCSMSDLVRKIAGAPDYQLRDKMIVAITTNETFFFRDIHPFETFRQFMLPKLSETVKQRKLRMPQRRGAKASIWSCACSTGQEPYSLSMILYEYVQFNKSQGLEFDDFSILATDISSRVLAKAMAGEYSDSEMSRGITQMYKTFYFDETNKQWSVKQFLRKIIEFRTVNLIESFSYLGSFDIIFCRNILIYFDEETKKRILEQFYSMLAPEGILLLGSTENIYTLSDKFESRHIGETVLYIKK